MRNRTGPLLCMALAAPLAGCVPGDDHEIAQMVAAVRPDRARHTVETLVGFGTRNTLSDTEHATRGIGAARRWILSEFERIRAETGGRLVVETDRFTYGPDGNRILRPTDIMNVVATLPGRQPASADRIYVISGHYDSMGSDPKDGACDAPGADDDASGVAVVLEAARALAGHEFDATIVFMAVAGEEQGLVGSRHWAQQARAAKRDIAGMFTNDIVGASRGP
ncbi:MAG: M20/M25/M40 family metallo-hydrolase, partial [Phycisphaerae bacterium]